MLAISLAMVVMSLLTFAELRFGDRLSSERLLNVGVWGVHLAVAWAILPLVTFVPIAVVDARILPFGVGFALYFVAMDLGEYGFHRAQHSIPWLWKLHALHHSDVDMTATTTERHFWGDQLFKSVTVWPAAACLVHPSAQIVQLYMICSLWNYVCHSRLPLTFGRLSWALNGPAYHRCHHSALPEHYNSNFAALLPIWDVLAGSYRRPSGAIFPTGLGGVPPTSSEVLIWPLRRSSGFPIA